MPYFGADNLSFMSQWLLKSLWGILSPKRSSDPYLKNPIMILNLKCVQNVWAAVAEIYQGS